MLFISRNSCVPEARGDHSWPIHQRFRTLYRDVTAPALVVFNISEEFSTNMSFSDLSQLLQNGLDLNFPPVAASRVRARPQNVAELREAVPSACTFWRRAERGSFFAGADAHMGCPIGAMVMGFELPPANQEELMSLVGDMCAVAYINEDEVDMIPAFEVGTGGVVYGPLADFPIEPELVIVWATPRQAMLLEEAVGMTRWTGETASVFGRPACAALPASAQTDEASISLGCIGMRTFTEIPDSHSLIAIPAARWRRSVQALRQR